MAAAKRDSLQRVETILEKGSARNDMNFERWMNAHGYGDVGEGDGSSDRETILDHPSEDDPGARGPVRA